MIAAEFMFTLRFLFIRDLFMSFIILRNVTNNPLLCLFLLL